MEHDHCFIRIQVNHMQYTFHADTFIVNVYYLSMQLNFILYYFIIKQQTLQINLKRFTRAENYNNSKLKTLISVLSRDMN